MALTFVASAAAAAAPLRWRLGFCSSDQGVRRFSPPHCFAGGWVFALVAGHHLKLSSQNGVKG
jgi:quinol-cytochrome oxidoreductase complex cytochrome b subunit